MISNRRDYRGGSLYDHDIRLHVFIKVGIGVRGRRRTRRMFVNSDFVKKKKKKKKKKNQKRVRAKI